MATAWRIITVNMNPSDDERLIRLADLWGLSKAATVRRLIAEATVAFTDEDVAHTCTEGQRTRWGYSNPELPGGPCAVCWPEGTLPTRLEKEDGYRTAAFQHDLARQPGSKPFPDDYVRVPWWVHVVERRKLHAKEAADAVDEAQEALDRIADDEATWMDENERLPRSKRRCTARTKSGARCRKRGTQVKAHLCGTHRLSQAHQAAVKAWKRQAEK